MSERIGRRDFLNIGGLTVGGLIVAACSPKESKASLERERLTPIEYGFNTHMSANPSNYENLTLEAFKEDIVRMKEMGMNWVRFNVWEWELAEQYLEKYDEAIKFAHEAGLKVFLVTNVPGLSEKGQNIESDLRATRDYYQRLVPRWKGQVNVWQVNNEPDDHEYDDYARIKNNEVYPIGYLAAYSRIVAEASQTIKSIDPEARVTINVSLWQGSDPGIRYEEAALFDAVKQSIDYVTLDFYPDTSEEAINTLQNQVAYFHYRYNLPVLVGELGLPTGDGRFSETDQGIFVSKAIDSLQSGRVRPEAILLYEFRDEAMRAGTEASFGFNYADGTPKPGFNQVIEEIKDEQNGN